MIGTTVYLGTWQLSRYEWKKGVIADRIAALGKEPIDITEEPLSSVPQPSADQLQLVRLRGELDLGRGVTVSPRPPPKGTPEHLIPSTGNSGALVVAPLVRPDGSEVLVLRGWYPLKSLPAAGKQQIDVVGYLRAPEQPGTFAVPHREAKNDFAWMDIQGIARHTGLNASGTAPAGDAAVPLASSGSASTAATDIDAAASGAVAPPAILVEVIEPSPARGGTFPLTRQMATLAETFVMPDTHLIYAGTWYTLAFFGSVIAWARFRRRTQLTGRQAQRRYYPGQD